MIGYNCLGPEKIRATRNDLAVNKPRPRILGVALKVPGNFDFIPAPPPPPHPPTPRHPIVINLLHCSPTRNIYFSAKFSERPSPSVQITYQCVFNISIKHFPAFRRGLYKYFNRGRVSGGCLFLSFLEHCIQ